MSKRILANRFNKNSIIRIFFIGKLNLSIGSDRLFAFNFSKFLNLLPCVNSKLIDDYKENLNAEIMIFKKSYPIQKIIQIKNQRKDVLIGIINPSDKYRVLLDIVDFAIVGSVEEKAYYSKYLKCFIYPLIEEVPNHFITEYNLRPKKEICYHGNKQHLDLIDINIEKALIKLVAEGFQVKAIYDFKTLGKSKKKFITKHVQWDYENWLNEISFSTIGICPVSHYSGKIRKNIAKFLHIKKQNKNDFLFQYKNTINASRAFVFHQLKIPVVSEIGGSFHHIMGDETAGLMCYSEKSWYESIKKLSLDQEFAFNLSEKAFFLMKSLYDPEIWCKRFIDDLKVWGNNKFIY